MIALTRQDLHIETPRWNPANLPIILFQSYAGLQLETPLQKITNRVENPGPIWNAKVHHKTLLPFSSLEALRHFSLEALCQKSTALTKQDFGIWNRYNTDTFLALLSLWQLMFASGLSLSSARKSIRSRQYRRARRNKLNRHRIRFLASSTCPKLVNSHSLPCFQGTNNIFFFSPHPLLPWSFDSPLLLPRY